jgi:DNA recombination protein RmuC
MLVYFSFIAFCVLLIIFLIFIFKATRTKDNLLLHQKIDSLREELTKNILQSQSDFLKTSQTISEELTKLYEKIGSLNRDSTEILKFTKSFYDILKPTKTRGILGETILENLIKDILPKDIVSSQFSFRNGKKVDFLIKLPQGCVPIDAKFSLETFKNYMESSPEDKEKYKKIFVDSVKRRIEESASYIFPNEGTTDFSLMYVPSEAVYYTIITDTSLLDYAHQKKVFIVGPNNLYVYLKTILIGFQALKIEKRAKQIYATLKSLDVQVSGLLQDYSILGNHLKNAFAKYEDVRRKIENFSLKLTNMSKE